MATTYYTYTHEFRYWGYSGNEVTVKTVPAFTSTKSTATFTMSAPGKYSVSRTNFTCTGWTRGSAVYEPDATITITSSRTKAATSLWYAVLEGHLYAKFPNYTDAAGNSIDLTSPLISSTLPTFTFTMPLGFYSTWSGRYKAKSWKNNSGGTFSVGKSATIYIDTTYTMNTYTQQYSFSCTLMNSDTGTPKATLNLTGTDGTKSDTRHEVFTITNYSDDGGNYTISVEVPEHYYFLYFRNYSTGEDIYTTSLTRQVSSSGHSWYCYVNPESLTVTIDFNGAIYKTNGFYESYTYLPDLSDIYPSYIPAGQELDYYEDSEGNTYIPGYSGVFYGDTTIYAVFKDLPRYNIDIYASPDYAGEVYIDPDEGDGFYKGENVYIETYPNKHFDFNRWYDSNNIFGAGTYIYDSSYYGTLSNLSQNSNLVAQYNEIEYTLEYNLNGGKEGPETQTMVYSQPTYISEIPATWKGSIFLGWWTSKFPSKEQLEELYQPGDLYRNEGDDEEKLQDTILYAIWEEQVRPALVYDSRDNTWKNGKSFIYTDGLWRECEAFIFTNGKWYRSAARR